MENYPTRAHTRASSAAFFAHIFSLFDTESTSSIILGLQNKLEPRGSTATLMDFLAIKQYEFESFAAIDEDDNEVPLRRGQIRLAKNIQNWVNYELDRCENYDLEELTMDDYDNYIIAQARMEARPEPTVATTTPVQSPPMQYMQYQGVQSPVLPTGPMTPGYNPMSYMIQTPTMSQQSAFSMNVKCDIKQYPPFGGEYAKWPKYKRDIIGLAATHGLDDVFDPKYIVPCPSDPDYGLFQEKKKFVYSMFISRVTGGWD